MRVRTCAIVAVSLLAAIGCSKPADEAPAAADVPRETTPLHEAAGGGHLQTVQQLLADGADPNALDEYGKTPLHRSAENGHGGTSTALIEAGTDPSIRDAGGKTAVELAEANGHSATAEAIRAAGGMSQVLQPDDEFGGRLKPSLKYRDLASFEAAIGEPGVLLQDEFVWLFAPRAQEAGANTVFPYLVRAYDELRSIVGVDTDYIVIVYNFPRGNEEAFGGTSNCVIWYDDTNLRLDEHKEWTDYGVPHVSGYIEEMAHNFVHATRAQFGWEMVGWSIGATVSERVAKNPHHDRQLARTRETQAKTFHRYEELGHVFPADIEPNLVDRIHAHLLHECGQQYGEHFWLDFFAEVRKESERLKHPNVSGGDDALRDARYQITVDCFDRLPGLAFKELLASSGISLTRDVKSLHPMDPDWDRKLM